MLNHLLINVRSTLFSIQFNVAEIGASEMFTSSRVALQVCFYWTAKRVHFQELSARARLVRNRNK